MNTLAAAAASTSMFAAFDNFGLNFYAAVARADSPTASQIFAGVEPLESSSILVMAPLGVALRRAHPQFGGPLVKDLGEARAALLAGRPGRIEIRHGEILRDLDATPSKTMGAAAGVLLKSNSVFHSLFIPRFPKELMARIRGTLASVQGVGIPPQSRGLWKNFLRALSIKNEIDLRRSIGALVADPDTTARALTVLFVHYSLLVRRLTFEIFCEFREMETAALAKHFEFQKTALKEGLQSPSVEVQAETLALLHFFVQRGLREATFLELRR